MDERLHKLYTTPGLAGAYQGVEKLYKAAKKEGLNVTRDDIREYLLGIDGYTLTKPKRIRFKRNRVYTSGLNAVHMADLADMKSLAADNDDKEYILVIIDTFSKYVWAVPVAKKTATEVRMALVEVYSEEKNRCRALGTDKGKEFDNKMCKALFDKLNIRWYTTQNSDVKMSIVERVIRTLKGMLYRYMLQNLTQTYIRALPQIVRNYNDTVHSATGLAPSAINASNEDEVMRRLYPELWRVEEEESDESDDDLKEEKPIFSLGDSVRISSARDPFHKGYLQSWSSEIYTVDRVVKRRPLVYRIRGEDKKIIEGTFYKWELQKVKPSDVYRIDEVLDERTNEDGETEYLVRWQNFPDNANSWVPARDIIRGTVPTVDDVNADDAEVEL